MVSFRKDLTARLNSIRNEIQIVSLEDGLSIWEERFDVSSDLQRAWQNTQWIGDTTGIISASAQNELRQISQDAGLQSIQVAVSSDVINSAQEVELLRFEVIGLARSSEALAALVNLATLEKVVLISDAQMPLRPNSSMRISMSGYLPILIADPLDAENER